MSDTPLPADQILDTNSHVRVPDHIVLARARHAFTAADTAGEARPGRPTLITITGGTDYQVRRAKATLKREMPPPPTRTPPAQLSPGLVTHQSPTDHHDRPHLDGDRVATSSVTNTASNEPPPGHPPTGNDPAPPHEETSATPRPRPRRGWTLGLIGGAAAIAVWGGWVDLGRVTGFGMVQPLPGLADGLWINTAITLPIGIEAYGAYALRTWLSSVVLSRRTRRYAFWSAMASLVAGGGAQIASHLMKAHNTTIAPWWVTVVVSCVPVAVLGLATGLATLVRQDTTGATTSSTDTANTTRRRHRLLRRVRVWRAQGIQG